MGKSKHRKGHKEKLELYKSNKKKEQDLFKKKMMDNYIKMQQQMLANQEEHTSTEEVSGPEIDLDELNLVDVANNFEAVNLEEAVIENVEFLDEK